ncbi:hypothetical protein LNQ52_23130 [Klebsiella pneumoniae subsp. pneumoniae]|nr:hypothetical protein [Klebsiella pneumoniae subsp. pneumoniae]
MPSSAVCPERRRGWPGRIFCIRDGKIAAIGSLTPLPEERQIDARDCVISSGVGEHATTIFFSRC